MNADTLLENFEILAEAPGGISSLKKLIFELAISGKLVDQIPDEGNSQVLVDELVSTRESHLKERSLPIREIPITGDSQPSFEIPNSWRWTRLGSICYPQAGFAFKSSEFNAIGKGLPLIRIRDISTGHTQCHYSGEYRNEFVVRNGDWLIGMDGNFNIHKWLGSDALLNQRVTRLIFLNEHISKRFIAWSLQHQVTLLMGTKSYTTVDHLSTKQINEALIPVPPIAEQVRIVTKVDELMALCDQLEQHQKQRDNIRSAARKSAINAISTATTPEGLETAWKRIENKWEVFADSSESINALRELILDLSVRGDLGFENISSEAVSIEWDIDELKLDSDKLWQLETLHTNPTKGWSRLPLARLGTWGSGGTPTASRKEFYNNGTIPWAVIGDLNNGIMTETAAKITEKALSSSAAKLIPQNAVLIAMYGASIGKTAVSGIECTTNQAIAHCVVDEAVITTEYFFLIAKSLKKHLIKVGKGAAQPNISQTVLKHLLIDIPNLNAQLVVVSKVGQLMDLCDQLEAGLMARSELAERFARSVVSAA